MLTTPSNKRYARRGRHSELMAAELHMRIGVLLLSFMIVVVVAGTVAIDLGFMHASNADWPPHARFHGVWFVLGVVATHCLALGLLWFGEYDTKTLRLRIAALIVLSNGIAFFASWLIAPLFQASLTPDLPIERMPDKPLGLDGNLFSFLVITPLVLLGWWLSERDLARQPRRPI
jgi:hypothetical protein